MHRHLRIRNLSPAKRGGGIFGFTKNNSEISEEIGSLDNTVAATAPSNTSGYWTDSGRYSTNWSGSGTSYDPYLISTAQQLAGLSYMVYSGSGLVSESYYYYGNKFFKQTADIDLSAYYWQPIGIRYNRSANEVKRYFSGTYDGNGYTVSGVFTRAGSSNAYNYQGLFGYTYNGLIKNVKITDSIFYGNRGVGAIAGYAEGTSFWYCHSTSKVSATESGGGLIGYSTEAYIHHCYNAGPVHCTSTSVGGVLGTDGYSSIVNCYNRGMISGNAYSVGGFIGFADGTKIINCYNVGSVTGDHVGGFLGRAGVETNISHCYYGGDCANIFYDVYERDEDDDGNYYSGSATKIASLNSTSYAKNKSWYTNTSNWDSSYPWDFTNVWKIDSGKNDGYPIFIPKTAVVTANAGAGITSVSGSGEYNIGSTATVTATAKTGYTFQKWTTTNSATAAAVSTSASYSFTVTGATTLYAWATLNTYWTNINALNPNGQELDAAYFDLTISDTAGVHSGTYTSLTDNPYPSIRLGYGSTITISNIRSYVTGKYQLASVSAGKGITNNGNGTYTYTVTSADDVITIQMDWIEYYLALDGMLDGVSANDISGYGTCDVYKDGVRVAAGVNDFWTVYGTYHYGQTYEFKNIQCLADKAYIGVHSGSISGTITGDTRVILSFRTKTWEDYAASSYAGGTGTQSNPYIIKTAEQLGLLAKQGQSAEITSHFKLGANIDLSAHEWKPIGVGQTYRLQGTFDGDMHCINNMKSTLYYYHAGLFATVVGEGVVKNLIMKNTVSQGNWTGAISGLVDNGGTIMNCIVEDAALTGTKVGGITGWSWNSNIISNVVIGCTITATYGGTIIGSTGGAGVSTIKDNGTYANTLTVDRSQGGIYGISESTTHIFTGCYASCRINGAHELLMWGDENSWGNWSYNTALNDEYPVPKPLFAIGGISGSTNVYNYLKNTLGFAAA